MKKKIGKIIISTIFIVGMAAAFAGIFTLKKKVNNLSEYVQKIQTEEAVMIPELVAANDGWMITQFGDVEQQQEMCYTITTENGLVIVDGGYGYEAPLLRKIIAEYGDKVDAWILTHKHPDHITAFMDIMESSPEIKVEHIYTVKFPELNVLQGNASWDDYSALERFREMKFDGIEYLKTGDQLEVLGLTMEVLSAYSEKVDELSNDLMNDGSMMFRISGKKDSMLFCADVGKKMTSWLIDTYGDTLKSDYVQMGHHGFGGPDKKFYKMVDAKACFFDAPHWLMSAEGERSTREKEAFMEKRDTVIFSYYTVPNQIILK